jgi:hypothetical protein
MIKLDITDFVPDELSANEERKLNKLESFLFEHNKKLVVEDHDKKTLDLIEDFLLMRVDESSELIEPIRNLIIGATPALMTGKPATQEELQAIGLMFLSELNEIYIRIARDEAFDDFTI